MFEPRGRSLRYGLGAAVLVLALLDGFALVHLVGTQERQRRRATRAAWQAVWDVRPRLQQGLGGAEGLDAAVADAVLRDAGARELELFGQDGRRVLAHPGPAPVVHALGAEGLRRVAAGEVLSLGPVSGASPRLLTYAAVSLQGRPGLARFATQAPDLVEDLQQGRGLVLGHAVSLALLAIIAGVAFFPRIERAPAPPPGRVLDAYQEAVGLLRERGDRLEQQIREAAPLVRAGELTSGIAHEVRNGLGTIAGYARLIERGAEAQDAADAARAIRLECETLETVVRRFVDFVKDEELHPTPFEARRLLSRVAAREERSRPGRPIEVDAGDTVLVADEEMLERAVENLVRNARDAAGPEGRVRVACEAGDTGGVSLVVSDDGPGLTEAQRRALRPFHTTKPGGLGLGLAMVHKIASLHGGQVTMTDRAPRGLEVRLNLPPPGNAPRVTNGSEDAV
jgi:signal transduction histidine kinase